MRSKEPEPRVFEVGEVVAFRESDSVIGKSVKAVVKGTKPSGKNSFKYVIEVENGRQRTVVPPRIKGFWSSANAIDEEISFWVRLSQQRGDEIECDTTSWLIEHIFDSDVISLLTDDEFAIASESRLKEEYGIDVADVLEGIITRQTESVLNVSPLGGQRIIESLAKTRPELILNVVNEWESTCTEKSTQASSTRSAAHEWRFFKEYYLPRIELARIWCGYESIRGYERLLASEKECDRLFELCCSMIRQIGKESEEVANSFKEDLLKEQIAPYSVRKIPSRPLTPEEIPVREVLRYRPRRWS